MSRPDRCTGFLRGPCENPAGHDGPHHSALDGEWREPVTNPPPKPERSYLPAVWDLVVADMQARDRVGRQRYRTPLQPFNGRNALRDAYEEALDQVVYLRQALWEQENPEAAKEP